MCIDMLLTPPQTLCPSVFIVDGAGRHQTSVGLGYLWPFSTRLRIALVSQSHPETDPQILGRTYCAVEDI